jgi:VWFA-related protein
VRAGALLCLALLAPLAAAAQPAAPGDRQFEGKTLPEDYKLRDVEVVHLDDVYTGRGDERRAELYVRALTRFGEPVTGLKAVDFEVREDDRAIDPDDLTAVPLKDSGLGITCVVLVDASRTMSGEPFERAKQAAVDLLQRLGAHDRVAVIRFAGAPEVVVDFDESKEKGKVLLQDMQIEPNSLNTTLFDAVVAGVELVRRTHDLPRRTFLAVLSDGNDGGSQHSLEQAIARAQGGPTEPRALVFTIGYSRFGTAGLATLRSLSEQTGAEFFEASSAAQIGSFYDQILVQMHESYVLGFPTDLDGADHHLQVIVEGHKGSRNAVYRDLPRPLWPWLAGGTALLLSALLAWLVSRARRPGHLVFVDGPQSGHVVQLRAGRLRIGSRGDNDLVIDLPQVSRCHAEVNVRGRAVEIEDLHSRNGTQVNGAPVKRSPLRPGDRITIADVGLRYER